jgi:hypothetical protein
MRQFDKRVQEIENQLDEGLLDGMKKTGKWLGKQGKAIAHLPAQAASSTGQLIGKGAELVGDVGRGAISTGKSLARDPSQLVTAPLKFAGHAAKAVGDTVADPSGTLKAASSGVKDAVTDYIPDTAKRISGHVGDTFQSIGKAGKALASGKNIVGPNTIANLTGTKVIPGFKKDRTVLGHGIDAAGSASSAYSTAATAANPANLARNIGTNAAINTGANIMSNRLQDGINKTKTSDPDKGSTKPKI